MRDHDPSDGPVGFEQRGRVAVITLRRPEARNAVNGAVASGLEKAIDRLETEDQIWAGVLAAQGSVFCAGADLKVVAIGAAREIWSAKHGFAGIAERERTKPLVAAIEGPALAGGCEIALACDLVVASTAATFGLPEVARGLIAAAGGLFRLPRALPPQVALKAILTGEPIDAETAYRYGLVVDLVEPGAAETAAIDLAERICANAPLAVRASRRVAVAASSVDDERLWALTQTENAGVARSEDFREGPRAFIEKRQANWKAR